VGLAAALGRALGRTEARGGRDAAETGADDPGQEGTDPEWRRGSRVVQGGDAGRLGKEKTATARAAARRDSWARRAR
jgi:hypothetical protein